MGVQHIIDSTATVPPEAGHRLRFVIQEHHASTHHFDFRLEKDEVFKSWAVPKGLPDVPGVKRLAVQVEDHDLAFGSFEGIIPEGQYGAGEIRVWDSGLYEAQSWTERKIVFTLFGNRVQGAFQLIRFTHGRPADWLIFKLPSQLK
jgi:bifunctional non-homologous end joining protein LigD